MTGLFWDLGEPGSAPAARTARRIDRRTLILTAAGRRRYSLQSGFARV